MSVINGFVAKAPKGKWEDLPETAVFVNGSLSQCSMRPNQKHIFDNYRNQRYFIMEEPPGAGKSTTIKFIFAKKLKDLPQHKLIIAIPQTFISKSFGKVILKFDDGCVEWDISKNLCQKTFASKINQVVKFLERKKFAKGIHERILITTHIALAKACDELESRPDKAELFKETTLVVDEAHHVLYPENGFTENANKIGKLVQYLVETDEPTTCLWFATATFYRGDRGTILPTHVLDKFERYFLPLDQHWEDNIRDRIEAFSFDFVVYKDSPFKEVKQLLKANKKKTIIFCPYTGLIVNGDKLAFKDKLVREIHKVWPGARIVDLVTTEGREHQKKIIYDDSQSKDVDIILSVKIFDEGADWKFAEQIMDLAPTDSLRVQGQRNGRLWRYDRNIKKDLIAYYMFLPFVAQTLDEEAYRRRLSENYTAFTASILIQEAIQPIGVASAATDNSNGKPGPKIINWFVETVPDDNKRRDIIDDVCRQILFLRNRLDDVPAASVARECVEQTVREHGIEENVEKIAVQIIKMLRRRIPNYGVDISWMLEDGFDKVWKSEVCDMLLSFGTGVSGVCSYKEFRDAWGDRKTVDEWVVIAETLAAEHGGVLPSRAWLNNNHYKGLDKCMEKHPKCFAHIKQEFNGGKTVDEWVKIAEQLANEHDGILPSSSCLVQKKLSGMKRAISRYPEKFSHIKQEFNGGKTVDEWVKIAEQLAESNGGILPMPSWLYKNNYIGLGKILFKHPKKFSHIKQDFKGGKKVSEWVKIAEKLAKKNGGMLPTRNWLNTHKYAALDMCMRKNKDAFSHIKQDSRYNVLDEWVAKAEKLVQEHSKLPNTTWLKNNKCSGLLNMIYKHPEKFAHLRDK